MRIPDVLTVDECLGLFGQLTGTTRLMAELMYGSGLRLLELLRLRVKDVDLVRGLITVRGGKGDKSGSGSALEIELSLILIKYYSFGLGNN
jgi:site-specific recombinase XerD